MTNRLGTQPLLLATVGSNGSGDGPHLGPVDPAAPSTQPKSLEESSSRPDSPRPGPRPQASASDLAAARGGAVEARGEEQDGLGVRAALALLKFYRQGLSPLMQSTCRFLPTCSQYSIDSYKAHGVWKGTVLTAWRLMRCNPWGGTGYDPTAWPPVGLGPLFAWDYSAQVAVVVGAALVVRLGHALLFE